MAVGDRCADHVTPLYPQKLALTSSTGGGHSVGIVRSRTKATEFSFSLVLCVRIGTLHVSFLISHVRIRGPGSVVAIATGYGLDGPGIVSQWERDFPHLSRPDLETTQPPVNGYRVFPGGEERPEREADPSPPSSAVVMKV